MKNLWWGYVHINGKSFVKRFFDKGDMAEAIMSNCVLRIIGPFEADDQKEAEKIIAKGLYHTIFKD